MAIKKLKFAFNPLTQQLDYTNDVSDMIDGPASASDLAIAVYDGITGKLLKNSLASVQSDGRITLGANASGSLDAVTLQQLQTALDGVQRKRSVRVASIANLTLSGEQTIDGIAVVTGDRVLVKDQTNQTENGIYVADSAAWSRSTDANSAAELNHAIVSVETGSVNANKGFEQQTDSPNIGVDNIIWFQTYGAGTYEADGQGIELSGSTFSLELDGSTLSKSSSGLRVAALGITNAEVSNSAAIAYSKLSLTNSIVNADINASAAIAYSKLSLSNSILNADINASAAIEYSKLAALTADRALISSALGVVSVSAATATEVGYLSGVTSAIQTQLNTKFAYNTQSVNSDITLAVETTYLLDTSANRTLTLPAPVNNAYIIVKDVTGSAEENVITISAGAALVDGAASYVMSSEYESITLVSNGTNWFLL